VILNWPSSPARSASRLQYQLYTNVDYPIVISYFGATARALRRAD